MVLQLLLTVILLYNVSAQYDEYNFDPYGYDPYGDAFNPYGGGYDPYGYGDVPPPFTEIESMEQLNELIKEQAVTLALFRIPAENDDPDYEPPIFQIIEPFVDVASDLSRRGYTFAVSVDEAVLDHFKVKEWKIYTFLPSSFLGADEKPKKRFSGDKITEEGLSHFIASNSFPISGQTTTDTEFSLVHQESITERPICAVFSRTDDAWRSYLLKRISKAALEIREVIFTLFDKNSAEKLEIFNARYLDISPQDSEKSDYIGVYCRNIKTRLYYKLSVSFSAAALLEIAKQVNSGIDTSSTVVQVLDIDFLEPEYADQSTEPAELEEDPNVLILTGGGLEELLENMEHDLLLEFYAPWCGHCQRFTSEYSKVAANLLEEKVIVSKINADEEVVPIQFEVSHFPTLYYVKANEKDKPILFTGDLTSTEVLSFVEQVQTNKRDEL